MGPALKKLALLSPERYKTMRQFQNLSVFRNCCQINMELNILVLTLVISAVIVVSESEKCDKTGYTRVKRAKYYSSPPQRFYRRPITYSYPVKGVYSNTPPPSHTIDSEDPFPPGSRPPKVSKKHTTDGLGDEDINNIIKYLSKQDLDKIIEFAGEKDKYRTEVPSYNYQDDRNRNYPAQNIAQQYKDVPFEYTNSQGDSFQMYKIQETIDPISRPSPYLPNINQKPYDIEIDSHQENITPRIVNSNPNLNNIDVAPFDVQESMQNSQIAFFNGIQVDNERPVYNDVRDLYTDSKVMNEEVLPKPVNLREDEYYGAYTNNVPSVVKADSSSYKVESFGGLPLMTYKQKLESVSSYHVPHYTVTTSKKKPSYSVPSSSYSVPSSSDVPLEPAPPVSEAKAQSDAHLKATKIWTHMSKGTAYYLHSDGTLSLEKPQRPKPYGHGP